MPKTISPGKPDGAGARRARLATAATLAATLLMACAHKAENADSSTPPGNSTGEPAGWAGKMQSLSAVLSDLLPMVVSAKKFSADANQARIEANVRSLRSLAHSLNKNNSPPNADPTMALVSGLMAEDIERALDSLRSGNKEYARAILKDATNYCVSCHTQTDNGPSFPRLSLNVQVEELPRLERAEFYAATRQFDLAVAEFMAELENPTLSPGDAFAWERAARGALAIVVRVQKNPSKAAKMTESILNNRRAPPYVRKPAARWLRSLQEWRKEKEAVPASPTDRLERAAGLVAKAQTGQKYPLDHSMDVVWFRAGGLLHDVLGKPGLDGPSAARALYLAGLASEATRDMNFWTMHETYYEMCIKRLPRTKQAQQCFNRLNDSVTLGYSGSAGVLIPPDVRKRLEGLRALAADASSGG